MPGGWEASFPKHICRGEQMGMKTSFSPPRLRPDSWPTSSPSQELNQYVRVGVIDITTSVSCHWFAGNFIGISTQYVRNCATHLEHHLCQGLLIRWQMRKFSSRVGKCDRLDF